MNDIKDIRLWLKITLAFGVGGYKKWQYINIDDPENSLKMLLSNIALRNDIYIRKYKSLSSEQIDNIVSLCERRGISIITPADKDYPKRLKRLSDPPSVLFVMGDIAAIANTPSIAVVGARDCCGYSESVAATFASELAARGVNVISGLARGIDRSAHLAALEAGGKTTAFLGCGLLFDYPKGTMRLKKLIAEHGAVISEYLPTTRPSGDFFKVRNRLITGLSDGVLVVEAAKRSGSLNTAGHAAEQGKEVFVIPPHDLYDPAFDGQSALLLDGAQLAVSPEQISDYLMRCYGAV